MCQDFNKELMKKLPLPETAKLILKSKEIEIKTTPVQN